MEAQGGGVLVARRLGGGQVQLIIRFVARHGNGNAACRFNKNGVFHDDVFYALLRKEWVAGKGEGK